MPAFRQAIRSSSRAPAVIATMIVCASVPSSASRMARAAEMPSTPGIRQSIRTRA